MHMIRTIRTVCGALALFSFSAVLMCSQVQAANLAGAVACDEETYGSCKFQVARAVVDASPNIVQSILTDYGRATKVFTGLKQCKVVEENGPVKTIAFVASAPGNFWTFDYVLEVKESPGLIEWHRVSGAFKRNEGFWKLEPIDQGRATQVTYAKFVDSGVIPQSFVNHELRLSLAQVMNNLKVCCEQYSRVAHVSTQSDDKKTQSF